MHRGAQWAAHTHGDDQRGNRETQETMRTTTARNTHASIIGALSASLAMLVVVMAGASAPAPDRVDAAFRKFWEARNTSQAARATEDVVASGASFDEALARLKQGRTYSATVKRGVVRSSRSAGGETFFYDVVVPADYDPSRRYQVRVQLHGGVGGRETAEPRGPGSVAPLVSDADQICILPYGWVDAPWWTDRQLENLRAILDTVKRTYNIEENRVAVTGISDGGTAVYYIAMRDTTPFASFLPLNGFIMVLANPSTRAEGDLFPNNMLNKPLFVINGGADPLYPARYVTPYIEHLQDNGAIVEYHPQETAGHNTAWWPEERDGFETFVREHPRDPYPTWLSWESAGGAGSVGRAHWLVIDRLMPERDGKSMYPDLDEFDDPEVQAPSPRLISHMGKYGRVDLERDGNTITATTRGVGAFTILLSPDVIDFSRPVKVLLNDAVAFEGRVQPSVATLMKWAARDNDRTMMFGAELHVQVPSR